MYGILYTTYNYNTRPRKTWARDEGGRVILFRTRQNAVDAMRKMMQNDIYYMHNQYGVDYAVRRLSDRQVERLTAEPHIFVLDVK